MSEVCTLKCLSNGSENSKWRSESAVALFMETATTNMVTVNSEAVGEARQHLGFITHETNAHVVNIRENCLHVSTKIK